MGPLRATHAFDGFAKVQRVRFDNNGTVLFTSQFLKTTFYTESCRVNTYAPSVLVADTDPPSRGFKDILHGRFDNNYIKPHQIGSTQQFYADTPLATVVTNDFMDFDHDIKPSIFMSTPGQTWQGDVETL